jgi:hypothetical protein
MKTLRVVAMIVVGLLLLLISVGALLPRGWRVERSVVIEAPVERVHPLISTLRRWQEWSVWTRELDPLVRHTFEGPERGVGARWSWLGPKMGRGSLQITWEDPARGVTLAQAIEDESSNARASFTYTAEPTGTRVTWVDEGVLPVVLGGFFRSMVEARLGANLEAGLQKLKRVVEALPRAEPTPLVAPPTAADAGP